LWTRNLVAAAAIGALVLQGSPALEATAAPAAQRKRPAAGASSVVEGEPARSKPGQIADMLAGMRQYQAPAPVAWSGRGTVKSQQTAQAAGGVARAGSLPVWIGAPDSSTARKAGRATSGRGAAQVDIEVAPGAIASRLGVVAALGVRADGGKFTVRIDVGELGLAPGAAERARLVALPGCAVATPEKKECRKAVDLNAAASSETQTLTATTSADLAAAARTSAGMVLAITTGVSGSSGNFGATPLGSAAEWVAGGNSGDFSWSYPLGVPAVAGGLEPELALDYSSSLVDGKTTATNNQASWIGEGWNLGLGFIDRTYVNCADDMAGSNTTAETGDLCWAGENATLSLGAHSGELIQAGTSNQWRLRSDDGTRVEKLVAAWDNGDNDREYWKVTTSDGTQYFFGLGKANASASATKSVWTVPVAGNQTGEPGHAATFAGSFANQAWRWNLDLVIDTSGNAMVGYYQTETNNYGKNLGATVSSYVRGGWLDRIEYGLRAGSEHSVTAPARVVFSVGERCLPGSGETCTTLTSANAAKWPDTPQDLICTSATSCEQVSPSFFSRKRLVQIRTDVHLAGAWSEVNRWDLSQSFPEPGDGTAPSLWLAAITPRAGVGASTSLPPVTFVGTQLESRVDGIEDIPGHAAEPFIKYRIIGINTGEGSEVVVDYSAQDCTPSSVPAPESNSRRCFPVWWAPPGATQPYLHWFHKYVVTKVTENDLTMAATPSIITSYQYTNPGWGYDESPLTPAKYRTWGRWAGFEKVATLVGNPGAADALRTSILYHRGLHGDRAAPAGGTKTVKTTDSRGWWSYDHRALAGAPREEISYNGASGPEVSSTVVGYVKTIIAATSPSGRTAERWQIAEENSRSPLAAGGWRTTRIVNSYDSLGNLSQVSDEGDQSVASDNTCLRYTYARDAASWVTVAATEQERATSCSAWPAAPAPGQVLLDVRYRYDNLPQGQVSKGLLTAVEEASSGGASPAYATVETHSYDAVGRVVSTTDALGATSQLSFTPAGAGLVTGQTETSPDPDGSGPLTPHTLVTTFDPKLGTITKQVEAGGETTEATYDAWGRTTAVWLPGRAKASQTASETYTYLTSATAPSAVTTKTLVWDSSYVTSILIYDGFGRPRQSQVQDIDQYVDANGAVLQTVGRQLADVSYDHRGLPTQQRGPYFSTGAPATSYLVVGDTSVKSAIQTAYDGAGRPVKETLIGNGVAKWATTIAYQGEQTHVTPPAGGTPSTAIEDASGRTVALRQYQGGTPSGSYDESTWTYDAGGRLIGMHDAVGNEWTWGYDARGQLVTQTDPDAGTSTYGYDNAGQLTVSTDARGLTLARTYDALGRQTSLRDASVAGALRTAWTYDTLRKGHPYSSSRYVAGQPITTTVTGLNAAGQPTEAKTVVPTIPGWVEAPLAQTYTSLWIYFPDGTLRAANEGARGNLLAETFQYGYDAVGRPRTVTGHGSYIADTVYSGLGTVVQTASGSNLDHLQWTSYDTDYTTGRTTQTRFDRSEAPATDFVIDYAYTNAGAITRIGTTSPNNTQSADIQCFSRDYLQRLTQAWTPANGNCGTAPSVAGLGGAAPYWQNWTFDKAGNRLTETNHTATGDQTTTWAHPAAGQPRPHGPTSQTVAMGATPPVTTGHAYDAAGNTTNRTSTTGAVLGAVTASQTLTYSAEGRLEQAVQGGQTIQYADDADGARLLRRDATTTTLYLGEVELTLTRASGTITGTRYISFNGHTVAVRTGPTTASVNTLWNDHHNTATWQVNHNTGKITTRRTLPYGTPRGTTTGWTGNHSFVNGLDDPTLGLVRIGARDYDPATGRFLTPDPILDLADPLSWSAYAYAEANPVSLEDPSGLDVEDACPNPAMGCPESGGHGAGPGAGGKSGGGKSGARGSSGKTARNGVVNSFTRGKSKNKLKATEQTSSGSSTRRRDGNYEFDEAGVPVINKNRGGSVRPSTPAKPAKPAKPSQTTASSKTGGGKGAKKTTSKSGGVKTNAQKQAAKELSRAPSAAGGPIRGSNERGSISNRTSFRKATDSTAWENAAPAPGGGRYCSNGACNTVVHAAPGSGIRRDWDRSHYDKSWTNRGFPAVVSRATIVLDYQKGVILECISCNRGRGNNDGP